MREPESVARMMGRVAEQHGRLDILVNNAAGNFYAPSATLSPNAWRAVVETDLYGTFFCCQAVYPLMKAQGAGRIVSISMTLHYRGWPLMAHATAAKAGVDALTRTLALEWAKDRITVNAVAPGPIPTEGVKKAFTPPGSDAPDLFGMEKYAADAIPLGRWGTPDDIGQMVTYLASPAGEWITGAIMVVDGGAWLGGGAGGEAGKRGSGSGGSELIWTGVIPERSWRISVPLKERSWTRSAPENKATAPLPLPRCPAASPCS